VAVCDYPLGGMVAGAGGGVEQLFERLLLVDGAGDPSPTGTLGRRYLRRARARPSVPRSGRPSDG